MRDGKTIASSRAHLPLEAARILERRNLANGNPDLVGLIHEGMRVADFGCGTGSIARDVAAKVGPEGFVLGVDIDPALIARARELHGEVANLGFAVQDIRRTRCTEPFDVGYAARVLQWVAKPLQAVEVMAASLKDAGCLQLFDYDHIAAVWEPELPPSARHFYEAFLGWRADAGFDNRIGPSLDTLLRKAGLVGVTSTSFARDLRRRDPAAWHEATLWADVAATRGKQMVRDGYITEKERGRAETEYRTWLTRDGDRHTLTLMSAHGKRVALPSP